MSRKSVWKPAAGHKTNNTSFDVDNIWHQIVKKLRKVSPRDANTHRQATSRKRPPPSKQLKSSIRTSTSIQRQTPSRQILKQLPNNWRRVQRSTRDANT